jgi:beta-glucosidase/6-phospho-beta-glucosidase/beta-galactosidase
MKEALSFNTDTLQPLMRNEFVIGIATSAYQIENAALADRCADSVWDNFETFWTCVRKL